MRYYSPMSHVVFLQRNPNGVISVGFRDFESADLCVEVCLYVLHVRMRVCT